MTTNISILFLILTGWLSNHFENSNSSEVKMVIEIENIKHINGQPILIAVDKRDNFLKNGIPFRNATVDASGSRLEYTFQVPPGDYAVSIYQDVNKNGKMDKNLFGAPSEPYAFSRNYKPTFRAPKFDEVKINMNGDRKINISLIQP